MATTKKVTKVSSSGGTPPKATFVPSAENKSKATQLRIIACILWFLGIAAQAGAIYVLITCAKPIETISWIWIIGLLVVDFILVVIGSQLWKKSNRLDPASKKDKVRFFLQNQLGVIISVIAFLPFIIFALMNKDMSGKEKGILGGIAAVLLVAAGLLSADFNPPSIEEYSEQSEYVQELMGVDQVYGTKSGTKYHLFDDCQYLKSDRTTEIFEGTVAALYAHNSRIKPSISSLCSACEKRAAKAKGWTDEQLQEAKNKALNLVFEPQEESNEETE
ncbi:MAG: hypothetical protein LBI82_01605 [Dysgonamonadaceae bacterium]|jgi:hypothetical protein|nr:hypothetical protein [Dysgonamonadaceae bacterium]